MINYPKRNIAIPCVKTELKHSEQICDIPETIVEPNHESLYPTKLEQLHNDINTWVYHYNELTPRQQNELSSRIPSSLAVAEHKADKMLCLFVESKVNSIGKEAYYELVKSSMTEDSEIMLALRCLLAVSERKMPQEIEKEMISILASYGHSQPFDMWALLEIVSRRASINDRIIARIAYLILNAVKFNKRPTQLMLEG